MTPPATTFKFTENKGVVLIGKVTESESIEEYDPNFDIKLKYFAKQAIFKQRVKLLSDAPGEVKGVVEFMSCDDSKCLPPAELEYSFTIGNKTKVLPTETTLNETDKSVVNPVKKIKNQSVNLKIYIFIHSNPKQNRR